MTTFPQVVKNNPLKLSLFPDAIAVSPLNAFEDREVIAVGCSSLTGESWHGEICLINGGRIKGKACRPFLQQKIRTYAGNTTVMWLSLPSSSAPTVPLLLSSGDDSCLYVRSISVSETSDDSTSSSKIESSPSESSKKKKKKKKKHKPSVNSPTPDSERKSETDTSMDTTNGPTTEPTPKPPPPQNYPYQVTVLSRLLEHADIVTGLHSTVSAYPYVASSSVDKSLKLWNLEKGGIAAQTFRSIAPAWCARLADAEKSLLAGGYQDGYMRVWDARVSSGKELPKPVLSLSLGTPVYSIVWHPSISSVVVAGTEAGSIVAYDVRQPRAPLSSIVEHFSAVRSLEPCPWSPNLLASGGDDTSVRVFNLDFSLGSTTLTGRISPWATYSEHRDYVRGVAWSSAANSAEGVFKGRKGKGMQGRLLSAGWDYNLYFRRVAVSESKEGEVHPMVLDEEDEEAEIATSHVPVSFSDGGYSQAEGDDDQF